MYKIVPVYKDYLWGGNKLLSEYHMPYEGDILAEAWILADHPMGECKVIVDSSPILFSDFLQQQGKEILGKNAEKYDRFPILIKLLDSARDLSIQVHPDDDYALAHENEYGKTEAWFILEAEEDAHILYGLKEEVSKDELKDSILTGTVIDQLKKIPVKKGDVFFISPGTIHAVGKGIVLAEIQQNSDVTYRVYDYNRTDKDGHKRPLHIQQALDVASLTPSSLDSQTTNNVDCDYFCVDWRKTKSKDMIQTNLDSFVSLVTTEGEGTITSSTQTMHLQKGDSIFLPAGSYEYQLEGCLEYLVTRIK